MAIDPSKPTTRRALLTGLVGGIAAAAGASVTRSVPARAASGSVNLGATNTTTRLTTIRNTTVSAFKGVAATAGVGVEGDSDSGAGVYGFSNSGQGVWGQGTDLGVYGASNAGTAIEAYSLGGTSLYAHSDSGLPIQANAASNFYPAIMGIASGGNTGIQGFSGIQANPPETPSATGVFGSAVTGTAAVGVHGESSSGRGGYFKGKLAPVRLAPSTTASHPTSGSRGDFFVDKSGRLWFCKGGTSWKQLA